MMSLKTSIGSQLIGHRFSAKGDNTFRAFAPLHQEWLPQPFTEATTAEIDEAVNLAAQAFTPYKKRSPTQRADFLLAIANNILALGDELLHAASGETGLPLARLQAERERTVNQLRLFAFLVMEGSWVNARIDNTRPDCRQLQVPIGVIGIFGASNFPLAFSVAGGDTAAALAAGCTVVFKAHPAHPYTSHLVATAIRDAAIRQAMPEGIFSLLHGATHETGQRLAIHPSLAAIAFTGSFSGGKALYDTATRRTSPIPVYAEMSSVNPVFFLPGALEENAPALATQFLQSLTMGVGQFCTNPGIFITMEDPAALQFVKALQQGIATMPPGYMLTPGILQAFHNGIKHLQKQGAQWLGAAAGDAVNKAIPSLFQVNAQQVLNDPAICREVFGPSSLHISTTSKEELYRVAGGLEGQLTATIHGTKEDLQQHATLIEILQEKAGRLIINGFPTGVAVNHAMVHGGPWPATTPAAGTSVGTAAIYRFTRPLCFQDFPADLLPPELLDQNPLGIWRLVNGNFTKNTL